jgi:chemotaxis protein CheZ
LMQAWTALDRAERKIVSAADDDRRLLNGPRLDGDAGHYSQDQVDIIFDS